MGVCQDLQMGATLATLRNLEMRGIARPETWSFIRTSKIEVDGTGIPRGFGNGVADWFFQTLSQRELNIFLSFFPSASALGVALFIQTYTDDGPGANAEQFATVMHRPIDGQDKQMITDTSKPTYNAVRIRFTRLEAV